jgi:hypothetical protein
MGSPTLGLLLLALSLAWIIILIQMLESSKIVGILKQETILY